MNLIEIDEKTTINLDALTRVKLYKRKTGNYTVTLEFPGFWIDIFTGEDKEEARKKYTLAVSIFERKTDLLSYFKLPFKVGSKW